MGPFLSIRSVKAFSIARVLATFREMPANLEGLSRDGGPADCWGSPPFRKGPPQASSNAVGRPKMAHCEGVPRMRPFFSIRLVKAFSVARVLATFREVPESGRPFQRLGAPQTAGAGPPSARVVEC